MAKCPKLTPEQVSVLAKLYAGCDLPLDKLPYSLEFDGLWSIYALQTGHWLSRQEFWLALCNARKAKKLVRKVKPHKEPKA